MLIDPMQWRIQICCSVAKSCPVFAAPGNAAHQAPLSFTNSRSLFKLMSIESVMLYIHIYAVHIRMVFIHIPTKPKARMGR